MTIRIVHAADYLFPAPVDGLVLDLGLDPAPWERARTVGRELSVVPPPEEIREHGDAWGNRRHRVAFGRPLARVAIAMHLAIDGDPADLPADAVTADDLAAADAVPSVPGGAVGGEGRRDGVRQACAEVAAGWRFAPHPGGEEPSLEQLWRERRGRCLELARLLVWRLRARGVPARFVLGYVLERSPRGAVRQRHAWVAHHDGARWRQIDPGAPDRPSAALFATAWGPWHDLLMPVRATGPAGLSGVAATWSTQVTAV